MFSFTCPWYRITGQKEKRNYQAGEDTELDSVTRVGEARWGVWVLIPGCECRRCFPAF